MKSLLKYSLVVALGFLFSYQANAQAFFGVYGGMNTAGIQLKDWKTNTDPYDLQPTFQSIRRLTFGVTCELPLSKYIYFQPEIAFTQKGGIMSIDSAYGDNFGAGLTVYQTVNNLDLNYVQLPLLFKVRMQLNNPKPLYPHEGTGKPFFFEFYLGPVINYLLIPRSNYSQTVTYTPAGATVPESSVKNVYSGKTQGGLKALDISAAVGGNIKWQASKKTFFYIDARYSMNFLNINDKALRNDYIDKEGNQRISYPTLKNSGNFALTLGITHTFTKRRYWNHPRMQNRRF